MAPWVANRYAAQHRKLKRGPTVGAVTGQFCVLSNRGIHIVNSNSNLRGRAPSEKPATIIPVVLTPKEAAQRLRVSSSWLAKARMRGDGLAYIQIGRAIRYARPKQSRQARAQGRAS
jgi:hypothetical protein